MKLQKITKLLASIVVVSAACANAQATEYNLLNIHNEGPWWIGGSWTAGSSLGSTFSDIFNISFDRGGVIQTSLNPAWGVTLTSASVNGLNFGSSNSLSTTFNAGVVYHLSLSGTAVPGSGGYGVAFNGSPVAAVPEPETLAMLLAGLGLVGWSVRRRQEKSASLAV
ncbi:hypothetical protein MIZ03_3040 [Rhodoferax lithotrophicus]|uniref:Ice-binding protein C-terminal domain-containing protein n=1 Tax=Rhodoferax lithotrophicus TaxID=2798804 RepID=A0ABN6D8T1_9BURK|nr:FxDxF family PEP-CTERM protein [Rhodoferax sp. MIZ03]BCO28143.1 hypothetical protein MIZ03_3040 [Rhodoferax sp. MIZ03]